MNLKVDIIWLLKANNRLPSSPPLFLGKQHIRTDAEAKKGDGR